MTDPRFPVLVARRRSPLEECESDWPDQCTGSSTDLMLFGDLLFQSGASTFSGIDIINVSDPSKSFYGSLGIDGCNDGAIDHLGGVYELAAYDNLVFAIRNCYYFESGNMLDIIDMNLPDRYYRPTTVASYTLVERPRGLAATEDHVFLALPSGGVLVVDVSDPSAPYETARYRTRGPSEDVTIEDDYLFLADGPGGLSVLDISNPAELTEIARFNTGRVAHHTVVRGDYVYVADGEDGLYILKLTELTVEPTEPLPASILLEQNTPNPFNPSTMIHFELPTRGSVRLGIYSVDGALVRTLVSNDLAAGVYDIPWDGRDTNGAPASSGIYFYRLETPQQSLTKKMVLVR